MNSLLSSLADLGAASADVFWLPVLAWTVLAAVVDGALRLGRAGARLGLRVRGSLVALLPLGIVGPPVLARWIPSVRPAEPMVLAPLAPLEASAPAVATPIAPLAPTASASIAWGDVALGGATVVALALGVLALIVLAGGVLWIVRYRRRLDAADASVRREASDLAGRLGIGRSVRVSVVDAETSPFTVGWLRPLVALPAGLDESSRRLALAHELAHVREAHFGWSLAERAVRAAFVWHPLIHLLGRGLALDRERVADGTVLGLWPHRAAEYGRLLHSLSTRPSPGVALGASSSPLLQRLDAMTHSLPSRTRFAQIAGALVLVLPLLASAAVLPDVPAPVAPQSAAPEPTAPKPVAPRVIAPETVPDAPPVPDETPDAPEPLAEPAPVAADTLTPYLRQRQVYSHDGEMSVRLQLTDGASYEIGEAIADFYSAGTERGSLEIVGRGFRITRSTLRADMLPPPPSPPAPAPVPPAGPPRAPEPPPPPPGPSDESLARYAERLAADLREIHDAISALRGEDQMPNSEPRLRLTIRQNAVRHEYQRVIEEQERRRIDAMRADVLGEGIR